MDVKTICNSSYCREYDYSYFQANDSTLGPSGEVYTWVCVYKCIYCALVMGRQKITEIVVTGAGIEVGIPF